MQKPDAKSNKAKSICWTGRKVAGLLFAVCAPILLANCAPQDQVMTLERRMNNLALENANMANKLAELQSSGGLSEIRATQADLSNKVDELHAEILRLNGMIDEMKHRNKQDKEEIMRFANEVKTQIDNLKAQQETIAAACGAPKPGGLSTPPAPTNAEQQPVQTPQETDQYQHGIELFKQKDFNDAEKSFKSYIDKNPDGKLIDNAYFWIGECEYNQEHFDEAILAYQKVISQFPKSNKVPDALLKQGMAFARLGDKQSARILLEKLIKQFPKSEQAARAKKLIANLK
ncbi:tol-pal system protein YbgF [Dissulfurimicrobium hydrothermale]|uniref:tol-pal system protein YbgF n=1 Tax=Dissulfurimicrobium hydrothermale TaxID=1750598 RepID=UPI001EDBE0B7|nr:tol-pal system protein YbgF [Dissulfurimicrobium hydrothermale]UKL14356.1 tol-pal system protein YbgF [Dissulfurimicrobium hydrothermale]